MPQQLYAPWRLSYITGSKEPASYPKPTRWYPGAEMTCFLCQAAAEYEDGPETDKLLRTILRGEEAITVLNRFPYISGHLLVSPRRHVAELSELTPAEHVACMEFLGKLTKIISKAMGAAGFNIGLNLGKVAGAGVPGHLHWHLVPRWEGDHNFMNVLTDTSVIPQTLDALWDLLRTELEKETAPPK